LAPWLNALLKRCQIVRLSWRLAELPGLVVVPDQRACSFDGKVFAARRRHHIIKINRDHEIAHVFGPEQSDRLSSLDHSHGIKFHGFLPGLGLVASRLVIASVEGDAWIAPARSPPRSSRKVEQQSSPGAAELRASYPVPVRVNGC